MYLQIYKVQSLNMTADGCTVLQTKLHKRSEKGQNHMKRNSFLHSENKLMICTEHKTYAEQEVLQYYDWENS
jgi:hypothetical protein